MKEKNIPIQKSPRRFCLILALIFIFSIFSVTVNATCQLSNLTSVTATGDPATDIVAAASAQIGKTGAQLGATENWCADFVFSCARLVGIGADVIPTTGSVTALYNGILNAGGQVVSTPQKGDLVFYSPLANTHVAIMTDSINSIHGNVNGDSSGSFHLTSRVTLCKYTDYVGAYQYVFVRPNYSSTPSQPLAAPGAPTVTVNGSSVTVSWTTVSGATGYNVFAVKDGKTSQWGSVTSTGSVITETYNNRPEGTYSIYIVAYNDSERAQSGSTSFTIRTQTLAAPDAPTVTVNGSSVSVSWTAVPGATGYNVFAVKDGKTSQWSSVTSTGSVITETYNDRPDGTYSVYIVAYNDNERAQGGSTSFTIRTQPVAYSVTLDTDGGTINGNTVTSYVEGVGVTLPTDVTKDGYTFLGWFEGDTRVTAIGPDAAGNKSFKAHWEKTPVTFSVTLDADGGTINSGDVTGYVEGTGAALPTDVTKTGYRFLGWFEGDTKFETIAADATGNKSFRAKWDPIDCPIQLYAILDGATEAEPFYQTTAKYGSSLSAVLTQIPASALEKSAYIRSDAFYYENGSAVGSDDTVGLSTTLYVTYDIRTFTVSFDPCNGTDSRFTQTVPYGGKAAEPKAPKKTGYQFVGWFTAGHAQFDFSVQITQDISLSAHWTAIPTAPSYPGLPANSIKQTSSDTFPFLDVYKSSWYYSSVKRAWENGLISGMTATRYDPDGTLSVAQAIKLAAALYQLNTEGRVRLTNGAPHWYDPYVQYAVEKELLDDGYLRYTEKQMQAPVQRQEFVHIFYRAVNDLTSSNVIADGDIPDVSASGLYADEIYTFYRAGILTGSDSAGTFYPKSSIRRSEVAAILIRLFDPSARVRISLR